MTDDLQRLNLDDQSRRAARLHARYHPVETESVCSTQTVDRSYDEMRFEVGEPALR